MKSSLDKKTIDLLVMNSLAEDIHDGDITSRSIFLDNKPATAEVIARETMILCGLDVFQAVFKKLDAKVTFSSGKFSDGDEVLAGELLRFDVVLSHYLRVKEVPLTYCSG